MSFSSQSIITIGETNQLSALEKRKLHLINGICLLSIVIVIIYLIYFIYKKLYFAVLPDAIGFLAFVLPLYFNAKGKYNTSKIAFSIGSYLFFAILCVMYGKTSGTIYTFIMAAIFPQFLFDNKKIIFLLFLTGFGFFIFFHFYYYVYYTSIAEKEVNDTLYFFNVLSLFVVTYILVKQFKYENETYQNIILTQNDALTQQKEEIEAQRDIIEAEKQKSESLLLNILPEEIVQELKISGQATPKDYALASVLFADFKGFTQIAEQLTPQQVIEALNTCFLAFDEICDTHNLEKIKTIGDCYMCAGGVPNANITNPTDTVKAALEMQKWMVNWKEEKMSKGEKAWEVRIGIHSGEVIAGVVGKNKFAYDIWGDTVNLASRMESSGEVGKVNISEITYELIKDKFDCTHRGAVKAKNKGEIAMYFVENIL